MSDHRPQPGFQTNVLACSADILVSGGSAGAGKTFASVLETLRHVQNPGFRAVIFRRTSPELKGAGSVWEQAAAIYPSMGGIPRSGGELDWTFPSGARVEFRHLQREDDVRAHQSKAYALIIFEEITHFTEPQWWYMMSRNRSLSGVRPYVRATCNPDPDSFVAKLVSWWIDQETGYAIPERAGVIRYFCRAGDDLDWGNTKEEVEQRHPELMAAIGEGEESPVKSFTFIPGRLEDNPAMARFNPGYRANLMLLPRILRERLLLGNWKVRAIAGSYFQRGWFEIADEIPGKVVRTVRFWDRAATEPSTENPDPDWTAAVKMAKLSDGRYVILHGEHFRGRPAMVERRIKNLAIQDGREVTVGIFQDPAAAGKSEVAHTRRMLSGFPIKVLPARKSKETMAAPFSSQAEGGNIILLRGDWNDSFLDELESFPRGRKDDWVDAASGAFDSLQGPELIYV